jgi:hypothetical protein
MVVLLGVMGSTINIGALTKGFLLSFHVKYKVMCFLNRLFCAFLVSNSVVCINLLQKTFYEIALDSIFRRDFRICVLNRNWNVQNLHNSAGLLF